MWGIRRERSLLVANGHPNAGLYPLGMLNDEAALVIEQENNRIVTEATLIQAAATSVLSKEGGEYFRDLLEGLSE